MPNPVRPLQCAQTLAHRQPAYGASPTRPPDRGRPTLVRGTQQTARPTPTPRGTNSGSGTRGTREGGEEKREGGNTRRDLGGVEGTHDQP